MAITAMQANGSTHEVTPTAPAHAGDVLVFYCVGLGAVNPPVTDGGTPASLSRTIDQAQVRVGSQSTIAAFAGLTPQFPGIYQVNVGVPAGTGSGAALPLSVTIGGQTSQALTIAIQ